jgi:DNA-directed RNA polymerase specialized sigma24 family protein
MLTLCLTTPGDLAGLMDGYPTLPPQRRSVHRCWTRTHGRFGPASAHHTPTSAGLRLQLAVPSNTHATKVTSETEQMLVNQPQPPGVQQTGLAAQMAIEPTSEARARRPRRLGARRAGNPEADLLRELHEQHARALWSSCADTDWGPRPGPGARNVPTPEDVAVRLPERPVAAASEQFVNRHLVAAALCRLTQEHRDVLRECYFRGSSVSQAAHALEIAPDMVKSRAYYALCALRLTIEELGEVQ